MLLWSGPFERIVRFIENLKLIGLRLKVESTINVFSIRKQYLHRNIFNNILPDECLQSRKSFVLPNNPESRGNTNACGKKD